MGAVAIKRSEFMAEQISFLMREDEFSDEMVEDLKRQYDLFTEYGKKKRNWENAFQKWSNEQFIDGSTDLGVCGYGSMCDWCGDNGYGRPCVRALNAMCREKKLHVNYDECDFERIWRGELWEFTSKA